MLIGYARTSTVEQVAGLEAQHAALAATGCNVGRAARPARCGAGLRA